MNNEDAKQLLVNDYRRENFLYIVNDILFNDFELNSRPVDIIDTLLFESVNELGYSKQCQLKFYEVALKKDACYNRVAITQEMFKILLRALCQNAFVAFVNNDKRNYSLSLLTSKYSFNDNKLLCSSQSQRSYRLGQNTKSKVLFDNLLKKGKVNSIDELIDRFSIEVVNKQFFDEIALLFTRLVGGERFSEKHQPQLIIQDESDKNKYAEFALRLIGRIVFCWFLKEKKSSLALIPELLLSDGAIKGDNTYYHGVLEPLFFEILNTKCSVRKDKFATDEIYRLIPYLNGGLFMPHIDDHYTYNSKLQCGNDNIVLIPDEWFKNLFEVLLGYNFTVDENTSCDVELSIDPEMLGRIFENLIAEINPETGESAKKSTGSFYTPREIVDYMVDTTLLDYLKSKTEIDENILRSVISYIKDDSVLSTISGSEKEKIIDSLYNLKALDPACGSGAFPIGLLQKIVYILQVIDPSGVLWINKVFENVPLRIKDDLERKFRGKTLNYIRKLSVIQNSIFGVDIQPLAVEIARNRCFLSLIIEEEVQDDKENRGISLLPNLDFKFVVANTLIQIENDTQRSFFENQTQIEDLKVIRDEYFNADSKRHDELKEEFNNVKNAMNKESEINYQGIGSKRHEQLSKWNPFNNEKTDWFDPEWQFGFSKFDIVIANPPYVHLEKMSEEDVLQIIGDKKRPRYLTYLGRGDLYGLFYERGLNLLKPNGFLTYITSNKWMRSSYGEPLRDYFIKHTNPIRLIDLRGGRFSSATVDTNIITLQMSKNEGRTICATYIKDLENINAYVREHATINNFKVSENWIILNPIEKSIKEKIEAYGVPLSKWSVKISRGILTGCNEAYIIDESMRDKLIAKDPKSIEIIRPVLRGRDIKRDHYKWTKLYIIGLFPARHYDIDEYPAIKEYLLDYGYDKLKQTGETGARAKTYNKWFELQDTIAYWDDFNKPKIIYPETTQGAHFVVDNNYFMTDKTCFIMTGENLDYIASTLSSQLFEFAYKRIFSSIELGRNTYQYNKHALIKLPIRPTEQNIKLTDSEVYDLYNINNEEIMFIQSSLSTSKMR
ncbi:MAG: Eco57I restriction-modification methylase domain-containing protein [Christensenellaceae bacterium]|nr:Eco57I restriction-modification methylase domain-containing protein [Christensenellaceae bacterium]